jgi:hypothetical protein
MKAKTRKHNNIKPFSIFCSASFVIKLFKPNQPILLFKLVKEKLCEVGISIADSTAKIMRVDDTI